MESPEGRKPGWSCGGLRWNDGRNRPGGESGNGGSVRKRGEKKEKEGKKQTNKTTVKGSSTGRMGGWEDGRMGEGGETKPLTLVAVCGLLATLSATDLCLRH